MKKFLKQLAISLILITLGLTIYTTIANAADSSYSPIKIIQEVGKNSGLPDFNTTGQHPDAPPDYLQKGVGTATSPIYFAIDLLKYVMSGIAIIVIMIQAFKLISTANEEEATKAKSTLIYGVIGLLVIQLADVGVKKIFFGEQGEALQDVATAELFAQEGVKQIRGIIGFVEVFVAATAVLVIVIRGFLLVTSAGEEEKLTKAKNHIIYALIGLIIVMLAEVIVRGVIFPKSGEVVPDINRGKFVIIEITNYISGFVAIISFLGLFYGGYKYVISGGNEEETGKVKKILTGSIISLLLAFGAYAIVNTVIKMEPAGFNETQNTELTGTQEMPQ